MKPRLLLTVITAAALVVAGAAVIILTINQPPRPPRDYYNSYPTASSTEPGCPNVVTMYFKTDEAMQTAIQRLESDTRFYNVVPETKAQGYQRFKQIYKDQPELISLTKPESMPASVSFATGPSGGMRELLAELRSTYASADVPDPCDFATTTATTTPSR